MIMKYPKKRLRRLRHNKNIRDLFEDVSLSKSDLIYPIFICEGKNIKKEIPSLPNQYQLSIDNVNKICKELIKKKIKSIILFGVSSKKDETGLIACSENSIIPKAVKEIKKNFGDELLVICDLCNCSYTSHGHCGTLSDDDVDNDLTIKTLQKQAVFLAKSGADVIAPSDMMDGRVIKIREILDEEGFNKVPIFSYSEKYASSFYGPFRDAVDSSPQFGDRKSYQMNYKNSLEFYEEIQEDINEGCDAIIIKPALSYLDVIARVRDKHNIPIIAYNVSGEYSLIKAGEEKGFINEKEIIMEILYSIKRAGANAIITYHAIDAANYIDENNE